jgi:hypothetical protein
MADLDPLPTRAEDLPLAMTTSFVGGGNGAFVVGIGVCVESVCEVVG